jgi:hypothetical protein
LPSSSEVSLPYFADGDGLPSFPPSLPPARPPSLPPYPPSLPSSLTPRASST